MCLNPQVCPVDGRKRGRRAAAAARSDDAIYDEQIGQNPAEILANNGGSSQEEEGQKRKA